MPAAVNAGLGELGRYGMLIHEEFGSRLHLTVVSTDLPLTVDEPVDIGVEDFCRRCMKCARNCPSYSISFGDKAVINGVEKWAINVESCYKARLAGRGLPVARAASARGGARHEPAELTGRRTRRTFCGSHHEDAFPGNREPTSHHWFRLSDTNHTSL